MQVWHDATASSEQSGIWELSGRERETLALMAAGMSNAAIARTLWLSPKTVESHVRSIFSKLGISQDGPTHRRVQAVLMYLEVYGRPRLATRRPLELVAA